MNTQVLVPGMRLGCLPRARRERATLRAHRGKTETGIAQILLAPCSGCTPSSTVEQRRVFRIAGAF